jgi:hypothetical protein
MKYLLVVVVVKLMFSANVVIAQNISSPNQSIEEIKNTIYLEVGGSAIVYSINYERRITDNLWWRLGASYVPEAIALVEIVTFPIGISYLIGKDDKHLELGFAVTPTYTNSDFFTDKSNRKEHGIIIGPIIGYRFQPKRLDVIFKLAFTPLFTTFEAKFLPFGGLSLGYSF